MPKTLIIIPTYNEIENLPLMIPRLEALGLGLEVLVVDDGSPDGTAAWVKDQQPLRPHLHLIERQGKQGLGSAYVRGFRYALENGYDYIFEMDADFSHDPSYVPDFLEAIKQADVVLGSRYINGVTVVNWPMSRLMLSYFANMYARWVTGLPVQDATGGFKCFRADALRKLDLDRISSGGYSFQIEVNYKLWKKGCRLKEIPIIFKDRVAGTSKMSGKIIKEALFLLVRLRFGERPVSEVPAAPATGGISVVIVSYNVRELLDACLQSIRHAAESFDRPVEVIVFDNDSRDGTLSLLRPRWPEVTWLSSDRNLGFGSGCNRGAAVATRELLLFLNPDTLVREDTFRVMADFFARTPNVGAAGCKVVNRDGTLQAASKRSFPSPRVAAYKALGLGNLFPRSRIFGRYNLTYLDENETHEVDAISGSFLCVRSDVFAQVNGFDEDFFMYGEDLDLCYRIKLTGRRNYYHPETQVVHFKGESAKSRPLRSFFNFYEAMIIFSRKHLELRTLPRFLLSAGVGALALANFVSSRFQRWPRWMADLAVVNGTHALMNSAYQHVLEKPSFFMTTRANYFLWHALVSLSVLLPFAYIGEYGRRLSRPQSIVLAAGTGFLAFFSLSFFMREQAYSRVSFASTAVVSIALLTGWRWAGSRGGKLFRRIMEGSKRVAIVGTNARALELARLIQADDVEGYEHVGFIHFPQGPVPPGMKASVIGDLEALASLAPKLDLQGVIIVLEEGVYPAALQVLAQQKSRPFDVKMLLGAPERGRITLVDLNFAK